MKPTTDQLEKIMEACARAPSGDNCQPWRFQSGGDAMLEIILDPERDLSAYNIRQTYSLFALGAAATNAQVAVEAQTGRTCQWRFENNEVRSGVGRVCCWLCGSEAPKASVGLAQAVWRRQTDRRPFASGPLRNEERTALTETAAFLRFYLPGVRHRIIESKEERGALTALIRAADPMLWDTAAFRDYMLSQIMPNSVPPKPYGMPEHTLRLAGMMRAVFFSCRLSRHWAAATAACGGGRILAELNARLNRTASAFLVVSAASTTPGDIVAAGAAMQRLWLTLVAAGLAAQPMCSLVINAMRLRFDGLDIYSPRRVRKIRTGTAKLFAFLAEPSVVLPLMVLRIGRPLSPIDLGTGRRPLAEVWRPVVAENVQPAEQMAR